MTESGHPGDEDPVRTDIPHPARVYDYWLGGKDNFEADRSAAEWALANAPEMLDYARGNRDWMVRAVQFLAADAGIRQFLDVGTGFPTSPNVNEIAQAADPRSRVVYVDNDPVVCTHAQALLADNPNTSVVQADMRDSGAVLSGAGELLDFSRPVALMFIACLHHLEDYDDPAGLVARYLPKLAPGSYLVLSHCTDEFAYERMRRGEVEARERGTVFVPRGKDAIRAMFNGRPLVEPGLVLVSYWRPEGGKPAENADRVWAYGGIAPL